MTKVCKSFKVSGIFTLTAIIILLLGSCDNFMDGGAQKDNLEKRINYANAESSSIIIAAEEGTGSTIPVGNYDAKIGYDFSISFSENKEYSFVKWQAVSQSNPNKVYGTNTVVFENEGEFKTKAKILKNISDIKIIPVCVQRIGIVGEPRPKYEASGVYRDSPILVEFTKAPGKSSFIFDENELPSGALSIKNDDGEIWAYKYNNQTFLKNISITNSDDISIAEHFCQPQIDGNLLRVEIDKSNPVLLDAGTNYKIIKITLSNKICDENGVRMSEDRNWRYQISAQTEEKSKITLTCASEEGSIEMAGTDSYSIGAKIDLAFQESSDYQFVRWDYDSSVVLIADNTDRYTTATVLSKSEGDKPSQIKAICAPRLKITGFNPVNDTENPTVSKNSSIILTFNQNLPDDEEGLAQLDGIVITIGGSPVKSSFLAPVISDNIVSFTADKSNMLSVLAGQTKTVSVYVPSDLYYLLDDGTKITIGGNGKNFDYKIDSTTLDKTEVTFSASADSGTVTPDSGKTYKYSLGEEVNISFQVNNGYTFKCWVVKDSEGKEIDNSVIKIDDRTSSNTKLYVYDIVSGITVSALCNEDFRITEATPALGKEYEKDTGIKITFNKELDSECAALLNKIKISIDGSNIDNYFETRKISGKTITIENTKYLTIDKGSSKQITVTVPKDFFYKIGEEKVHLKEDYSFSYNINHTTSKKSKIWYQIIDGETGNKFSNSHNAGTINKNEFEELSIGETSDIKFELKNGYQFNGWQLQKADGSTVKNAEYKLNSINQYEIELTPIVPVDEVFLKAICYKKPEVVISSCTPYPTSNEQEFAKNTQIVITFDKPIADGCENAIELTYTGNYFSKNNNYQTTIDSERKVVTLTNVKMPVLTNAYETISVTVPGEKIYYLSSDNTKITMGEDLKWSFRINNRTMTNTTIRFNAERITIDGTTLSSPKETYNIEQVIPVQYDMASDSNFNGWKVESATTGYTVEPSDYTKTGTILVKSADSNKEYLKMEIDKDNPLKAIITVLDAIGNGVNEYGVTVSISDSKRPVVSSISTSGTSVSITRDTPVTVTFDQNINSKVCDNFTVISNGEDITDLYTASYNSGTKTLILTPVSPTAIPVSGNYRDITVTVKAEGVCYVNRADTDGDGSVDHNFITYMKDDYKFVYRINPETSVTTTVVYLIDESSSSDTDQIKIDSTVKTKNYYESYSVGKITTIQYTPDSGFMFTGWKLATDYEGYTIIPSGFTKSGTIQVIKDEEVYYTLEIDEDNPTKATSTVLKAMSESSEDQISLKVIARDSDIPAVVSTSTYGTSTTVPRDSEVSFNFNVEVERFITSGEKSAIKISSNSEDLTDLFTIEYNALRKTVTITPKSPAVIPVTTKYRDITVTIKADCIEYRPYNNADFRINMKEDYSFVYRINAETNAKTSLQYHVGKCDTSSSNNSIKVDGASKDNESSKVEYSIEETVGLQYVTPAGYKFLGWKLESVNGYTVTPNDYVTEGIIQVTKGEEVYCTLSVNEMDSSKANISILKEMNTGNDNAAINVYAIDAVIPKVISQVPASSLTAVPRDSIVTVLFNVDIGAYTDKSITVISNGEDIIDKYSVAYDSNLKTITLTPISPTSIPITSGTKNLTVTVSGDSISYSPISGYNVGMEKDFSFVYKINAETSNKTTVSYAYGNNGTVSNKSIKIDGISNTLNEYSNEYSVGQSVGLQYGVTEGYKFTGWKVEAVSGYTVTPAGYVTTGTITVAKNGTACYTLTIDEENPVKATGTILKAMDKGDSEQAVKVSVRENTIPYVSSTSATTATTIPRDSAVSFVFNVYVEEESKSAVRITSNGDDLTDLYNIAYNSQTKTISLSPKDPTSIPVAGSYREITVTVKADRVVYIPTDTEARINMVEDYTCKYRVNNETSVKTTVSYAYGNNPEASDKNIKIDGIAKNLNDYSASYSIGTSCSLEYLLTTGYHFEGWKIETDDEYSVVPSGYITNGSIEIKKNNVVYYTLTLNSDNPLSAIATTNNFLPNLKISVSEKIKPALSDSIAPAYASNGVNCDASIVIPFNTEMDKSTITCSAIGSIQIVNLQDENDHYESFFTQKWTENTLTLIPSVSIYNLLKEDEVRTIKVKFDTNRIKGSNGLNLDLPTAYHTYRINTTKESDKPVVDIFNVYKPSYFYGSEKSSGSNVLLSENSYSTFTEDEYKTNHVKNKIIINASVFDEGSGFTKLTIHETNISDSNKESPDYVLENNYFSYSSATGKYSLSNRNYFLQSENDGLIKIVFDFEDYAGNVSRITRYVIKDTVVDSADIVVTQPAVFQNGISNAKKYVSGKYFIPQDGFVRESDNGIDSVTFTFQNTREVFYKVNNNTKYSDSYSFIVEGSYDSDFSSIYKRNASTTTNSFTIQRDETKVTYFRFSAYDSVGNMNSIVRVVLPKTEICETKPCNNYGPYMVLRDYYYHKERLNSAYGATRIAIYKLYRPVSFDETSSENTVYLTDAENDYLMCAVQSRYYETKNVEDSYPMFFINTTTSTNTGYGQKLRMPPGKYNVYVILGLRYRDDEMIYGTVSEPYPMTIRFNETTQLNELVEESKTTITGVTNLLPSFSSSNITVESEGINSGSYKMTVKLPSSFTPVDGYKYYVKVASNYLSSLGTSYYPIDFTQESTVVRLKTGDRYLVYIEARDSTGNSIKDTGYTIANCQGDNSPPIITYYEGSNVYAATKTSDTPKQALLYYKYAYQNSWPKDSGGAGLADSDGNFTIEYWNIKNPLNTESPVSYTYEQLNSEEFDKYKNTGVYKYVSSPGGKVNRDAMVRLKYEDLDEGYYTLAIKITDQNQNYTIVNWPIYNIVMNKDFSLSCINEGDAASPNWMIKANFGLKDSEGNNNTSFKNIFEIIDGSSEYRLYNESSYYPEPFFNNSTENSGGTPIYYYSQAPVEKSLVANKFVRVIAQKEGKGFYNYQYIYPDYYIYKGTEDEIACKTKNIIGGFGDNYQIYTDNPIYMHTMYWTENLGENPTYWETKGLERGVLCDSNKTKRDFTYSVTDEIVPSGKGYWYVVVAHFADGTVIMTNPKQKK